MKLAVYGRREWLGAGVAALALGVLWFFVLLRVNAVAGGVLLALTALAWLAVAAFFRVPSRSIPEDETLLVSPADGVVKDIGVVSDHGIALFEGRELVRVGIFLSVLDVHVNRAPCRFEVEERTYKEGRFLDARNPRCAQENESLVIAGRGQAAGRGFPVAVRQISGAIARRIVCEAAPGSVLKRGEIYGMIKFGSRTEIYLPPEAWMKVAVKVGDKVRSGSSVVARITV